MFLKKTLCLLASVLLAASLQATTLVLEAEKLTFDDGWSNEGAFLKAKQKNAIAEQTVSVKRSVKMNIWVLTATHGGNWRKAEVSINGRTPFVFGDEPLADGETAGVFHWVCTPTPIRLTAGDNKLAIRAIASSARVDKIILTDDLKYIPGQVQKLAPLAEGINPEQIKVEAAQLEDTGLWENNGTFLVGGTAGALARGTFTSSHAQIAAVWVKTMTHNGNFRKAELSVNGLPVGMFGDEPLKEGQKPGWHWVRLPAAHLDKGENTIEIKAASEYARVSTIYFANTESFSPLDIKPDTFYADTCKRLHISSPFMKSTQKGSPLVLALCGGRPWVGDSFGHIFSKAGLNVQMLNSNFLAGHGGAPIRKLLYVNNEPEAADGVAYEFKNLRPYKMIAITGLSEENQKILFGSPERVETLRKYVEHGGKLLLTACVPNVYEDLLPVHVGPYYKPEAMRAKRPDGKAYSILPETWDIYDGLRKATLKNGAHLIAPVIDKAGNQTGIYAATWKVGKGEVLFLNVNFTRLETTYQFFTWVYGKYFIGAIAQELLGTQLALEKLLIKGLDVDAPVELESAQADIRLPNWKLTDDSMPVHTGEPREKGLVAPAAAKASQSEIRFQNGARIVVRKDNTMDFFFPHQNTPYITNAQPPTLRYTKKAVAIEANTSEATDVKDPSNEYKTTWHVKHITGGSIPAILWESEAGDLIREEFKTGTLALDGVLYQGIAHRTIVLKTDLFVSNIQYTMQMQPNGGKARRFSCYQPPRGYEEYPLDGSKDIDTSAWGFFASGQPFAWLEGKESVYAGFVSDAIGTSVQFTMKKDETKTTNIIKHSVGYRSALPDNPIEVPFYWHMLASGTKAATNNGWMAMFQFQRHNLRKVVGFPEIPARPIATYLNTCTHKQRDAIIEKMGKAGFTFCYLPFCPSEMADLATPSHLEIISNVKKAGMRAFPWTPCGHTVGHPAGVTDDDLNRWWARTLDGKIYAYFGGKYPVIDQHHKDYLNWYFNVLDKEIDAGVGTYWFDMGGTATGTVNYSKPNSGTGLDAVITIYRHMFERGQCAITEGENPLALDGFIYRRDAYTPMKGKEYLLFGTCPESDVIGFVFDYFRLSMFDCFMYVPFDDYGHNFERYPGELKQLDKIVYYLPAIQKALDVTGMPFIRETPFGTTWISEKGGAIFCYNGVKNLTVTLPDGYAPLSMTTPKETIELNGRIPATIPPESIIVFQKK